MLLGKKILYDVAKPLQPNAEIVPRRRGAGTHGAATEFVSLRPTLEREVAKDQAADADAGRPAGQGSTPSLPLLAIELFEGAHGLLLVGGLPESQKTQQSAGHRIAGQAEFVDPFLHHLRVPKLSELPKQLPARPLHLLPGRVGIETYQAVGQGTAAAQSDAEIVDGIRGEIDGHPVTLLKNTLHPEGETVLLDGRLGSGNGEDGHSRRIPLYGRAVVSGRPRPHGLQQRVLVG